MSKYSDLFVGMENLESFIAFVHDGVNRVMALDGGGGKSYEGTVSISFPSVFEMQNATRQITLNLDCYVLGPARHYSWQASSLQECIDQATSDVDMWVREEFEEEEED